MSDSRTPKNIRNLSEEPTQTSRLRLRDGTLDATLPPSSSTQVALPGTEDTILSAQPICDRGTLTMVTGAEAGSVHRLGPTTVLGRSLDCEIRIFDVGVSRATP